MTARVFFLAPTIALALAACGGVVVYETTDPQYRYSAGDFDYATRKGAMHTIVAGNPFNMAKADFDARVLALMQGQNRGLPAKFVSSDGQEIDPLYKTVVAFNAATGTDEDELCRNAGQVASQPASDRVRLSIVFCEGDKALSSAAGSVGGVGGADDPQFAELVRETTFFMVPDDDFVEHLRNSGI